MKYLSKERVKLGKRFPDANFIELDEDLEALGWQDCPCVRGYKVEDGDHFRFRDLGLAIQENSFCEIRKINEGYLRGYYCLIENLKGTFSITAFVDGKLLRFPEVKAGSIEAVDDMLSNENIRALAIKKLTTYDVRTERQFCRSFCDALPKACFEDFDFFCTLNSELARTYRYTFPGVADIEDINVENCRKKTMKYFDELFKAKTQNKSEKERGL